MRKSRGKKTVNKEDRRRRIASLMAKGIIGQTELSIRTKIPLTTVHRLVKEVRELWAKECVEDFGETVSRFQAENAILRRVLFRELNAGETDRVRICESIGNIQSREMKLLGLDKRLEGDKEKPGVDGALLSDEELMNQFQERLKQPAGIGVRRGEEE